MGNAEVKVEDKTKNQISQLVGWSLWGKGHYNQSLENLFSSTVVDAEEGRGLRMEAEPASPYAAGTEDPKTDLPEGILSISFTVERWLRTQSEVVREEEHIALGILRDRQTLC